jgi:hypothetical protein
MSEQYVAARDARLTIALWQNGKRETLPWYVTGTRPVAQDGGKPRRQVGGMTAEEFDHIFPVWAARYPGRVVVAA